MNKHLIEFALANLFINKKKNLFIFTILSFLVFLSATIFFTSASLKKQTQTIIKAMPDIIVQQYNGEKQRDINTSLIYNFLDIKGVGDAIPRVWGYYYFNKKNTSFGIVGIDRFDYAYNPLLKSLQNNSLKDGMLVGQGVREILTQTFYQDEFSFITPQKKIKTLHILKTLPSETNLLSYDLIIMDKNDAKEILGIDKDKVSDIALYIPNKEEIPTIVSKIALQFPNLTLTTKEQLQAKYQELFNYKSGVFIVIFLVALFTFFIIVSDKLSGLSSNEQTEIAILKAIGWSIEDIIKEKFIESFIIAFFAFFLGLLVAVVFVYFLNLPILKTLFVGDGILQVPLNLQNDFTLSSVFLSFFITIPIYIASVIIPSWKIAVQDVDEVLR